MLHEYKYKLDFYYQQALIYLVTLIIYAGIVGTFLQDSLTVVFHDPILYIILFFVLQAFGMLVLNRVRDRKLIVTENEIIFQHRFNRRSIMIGEIEWIHIGKERGVQTAGRYQVVIVKVKGRRRSYRIRIGRYEKEKELLQQMHAIAVHVPKRGKKRFHFRKKD